MYNDVRYNDTVPHNFSSEFFNINFEFFIAIVPYLTVVTF